MASQTATIRVSRPTRDLLAAQARQRGLSVAALLAKIAREQQTAAMWESERQAARIDATNPEAKTEEQDWDAVASDGVE